MWSYTLLIILTNRKLKDFYSSFPFGELLMSSSQSGFVSRNEGGALRPVIGVAEVLLWMMRFWFINSLFINNWIWKCPKQEGSWTDWWKMLSSALGSSYASMQPLNYVSGRYLIVCGILERPVCANAGLGGSSQAQLASVLAEFGEKPLYLTFLSVWVCQRMAGSLNHLPINV